MIYVTYPKLAEKMYCVYACVWSKWWANVSVGKGYVGIRCIIFIHATFCKFEIISK